MLLCVLIDCYYETEVPVTTACNEW